MKRFLFVMLALMAAFTFAACGGDDDHHHDDDGEHHDDDHNHDDGEHHDDDHGHSHGGTAHEMGHHDMHGGHRLEVSHIGDFEAGEEVMLEIRVSKDGAAVKNALIVAYLGDDDGGKLTAPVQGNLAGGDDPFYDCHIEMPGEMPEHAKLYVECTVTGETSTASFEVEGHDHD